MSDPAARRTRSAWPPPAERCAPRALRRGDQMLGTAFPAARLLLIEQPFPWGPEGLRTSRFDRSDALAVEARCRELGVRVQAIRRPGRSADRAHRRWAYVDTRDATRTLRWGRFAHEAELLEVELDGSTGEPDPEPLHLVCTHGRHDPCCGRLGRPLTAALQSLVPGRVWQASHLGGCRFAATDLVLPLGLMYGRVEPPDAARIVAATGAGELVPELLRGRIGIPPAAQAAVAAVHESQGIACADGVTLVATTPVDPGTVVVRVRTAGGRFDVTVRRDRVDAAGLTCAAPAPSWFVAHRPTAIVAVPDDVAA